MKWVTLKCQKQKQYNQAFCHKPTSSKKTVLKTDTFMYKLIASLLARVVILQLEEENEWLGKGDRPCSSSFPAQENASREIWKMRLATMVKVINRNRIGVRTSVQSHSPVCSPYLSRLRYKREHSHTATDNHHSSFILHGTSFLYKCISLYINWYWWCF